MLFFTLFPAYLWFLCEIILSGKFVVASVLSAFLGRGGAWSRKGEERGLNRMAGENQGVAKGCFWAGCQESVGTAQSAVKQNKELRKKGRGIRGKEAWVRGEGNVGCGRRKHAAVKDAAQGAAGRGVFL